MSIIAYILSIIAGDVAIVLKSHCYSLLELSRGSARHEGRLGMRVRAGP